MGENSYINILIIWKCDKYIYKIDMISCEIH